MSRDREWFETRLSAYLGGDLDDAERAEFEAAVLADPDLAEEFAAAVNLDAAVRETVVTPRRPPLRWSRRRRFWLTALPAAAVVAAVLLWPRGLDRPLAPEPVLRSGAVTSRGVAPAGSLAAPVDRFVWTATPSASHYRLELYDADGRRRHTALVPDTVLARGEPGFPAVVDSLAGDLFWQVIPVREDGREATPTPPVVFRIGR